MPKGDSKHKQTDQQLRLADLLHERARISSSELRRWIISLSTGSLGVFFVALTSKIEPPLLSKQKNVVAVALLLMVFTAAFGLLAWYADGRRNYFWASAIQSDEGERRKRLFYKRSVWYRIMVYGECLSRILFLLGIIVIVAYMLSRVLVSDAG